MTTDPHQLMLKAGFRESGQLCLAILVLISGTFGANADPAAALQIRIPPEADPASLTLICGVYGNRLTVQQLETKSGHYDYTIQLDDKARSVRLLVYRPGFKMITGEMDAGDVQSSQPFVPHFERLQIVPLQIALLDSRGKPIAGEKLTLRHQLATHEYFGYSDGISWEAALATGTTDDHGQLNIELPSLSDDPYFAKYDVSSLTVSQSERRSPARDDCDFRPSQLPVLRQYEERLVITKILRARLSGRIEDSFLERNQIKGDVTPYGDAKRQSPFRVELRAENKDAKAFYNCMLMSNGNFSAMLPTGEYDLHLLMLGQGETLHKQVMVQE